MAHSNRQKIRDSQGGLTKNQSTKAGKRNRYRSDFDAEARIRELDKWLLEKNMKKDQPVKESKRRKHCMHGSAIERRKKVITAREKQLVEGYVDITGVLHMPTDADKVRITKEIQILKNRI